MNAGLLSPPGMYYGKLRGSCLWLLFTRLSSTDKTPAQKVNIYSSWSSASSHTQYKPKSCRQNKPQLIKWVQVWQKIEIKMEISILGKKKHSDKDCTHFSLWIYNVITYTMWNYWRKQGGKPAADWAVKVNILKTKREQTVLKQKINNWSHD